MAILYNQSTSTGTGATFNVDPPAASFAVAITPATATATVALHGSLDGQWFYSVASSTFAASTSAGTHVKAYTSTVGPVAKIRAVVTAYGSTEAIAVTAAALASKLRKEAGQ